MRWWLFCSALALAACSADPEGEQRTVEDSSDAGITTPTAAPAIEPQPILYPDIEKHELYGMGCSFAPDGGGLGAVALAMPESGYMKLGGEILKFSADAESAELPYLAREQYAGDAYAFTLTMNRDSEMPSGMETSDYSGELVVADAEGREVYRSTGIVQCGA